MKTSLRLLSVILLISVLISACQPAPQPVPTDVPAPTQVVTEEPVPTATVAPPEDVLYVNLMWHQHQPLYYKDETGTYTRPWVRVHATKDYYDMAYLVSQYPDVKVTFNLTPVLLKQIDDFVQNGAKDLYWVMAEKDAAELTDADKRFILERFFDANYTNIIGRFPRYQELLDLRGGSSVEEIDAALETFTEADFRDLQIWFNLAWFDPMFLEQEPLKTLVDQGEEFREDDKDILFNEVRRVMAEIVPLHKQMQDAGQIEVTTTPYAHPILPLLIDTNLQSVGNPGADLPLRFSHPNDALTHLERSVAIYESQFGQSPRGLWPGEGSVAEVIVPFVLKSGYSWMATGEPVLAKSLDIGAFTRDSAETVNEADQLYRPYLVDNASGETLAVFFRDHTLSDKVGFTYSGISGEAAASDLIQRLENIRTRLSEQGADGPHIVSIILDGENAWEYYPNDGIEFLSSLYQKLSQSDTIRTITPSEYIQQFPEQTLITDLFPGAWFSPNYDTWIGESEENKAWDYLRDTRALLAKYDTQKVRQASPEAIALAQDYMYLAEGSDWFWWYGADQDSGQDSYFDIGFRALLRGVYESLGEPVPSFVNIPIIQARPVNADQPLNGLSTPTIDGSVTAGEWDNAASYTIAEGTSVSTLAYTLDENNLYFRIEAPSGGAMARTLASPIAFILNAPRASATTPYPVGDDPLLTGFAASHVFEWQGEAGLQLFTPTGDEWQEGDLVGSAASSAGVLEASIPLELFGELEAGDEFRMMVAAASEEGETTATQPVPSSGPAQIVIPDLGLSTILFEVEDPEGDDFGPGTYTYPTDAVFQTKVYDLKSFRVSYDENNLIFKFGFYGPVPNPWGSPTGLAIQTLDVYIDKDPGAGTGSRLLFPGRNAALEPENGWDIGIWAEGWTPQLVAPDPATGELKQITEASMKVLVDPAARTVTLRIPLEFFGEGDPADWGYVAAVLGQEGYPAAGVWRVRDVEADAAQWRFGGAPADTNHTRILDLIWPADATPAQADMLGTYPASTAEPGGLGPDDFGQIKLLLPQ